MLNLFFPPRCILTGQIITDVNGISSEGFNQLTFITDPYCFKCAAPLKFNKEICLLCQNEIFYFQSARSVLVYNDVSKRLILSYKHGDRLNLSPIFSRWMAQYGKVMLSKADVLVPVPLHKNRLRKRLYNQAAELVKGIHKLTGIPYILDGLLRKKATLPQGHETKEHRIQNMKDAFNINPYHENNLRHKHIVIIDDVMTSGATLNSCAKTLLPLNPKNISVLTFCKVLLD